MLYPWVLYAMVLNSTGGTTAYPIGEYKSEIECHNAAVESVRHVYRNPEEFKWVKAFACGRTTA